MSLDMNEATAKAISAERAAAGLTIKDLSERSNVPMSTLIRILKSERDIRVNQIAQLADVLGLYPHEILQEAEKYIEREERTPINLNVAETEEHPERFTLVAKRGEIEREQEMYNDLPCSVNGRMDTSNSFVSHYLKQEMRFRGITQEDLRKTIGRKSQSYISDRLNNKNEWGLEELDKIAHLFGQANSVSLIISAYNECYSAPGSRSAHAMEEAPQKQQEKKTEKKK